MRSLVRRSAPLLQAALVLAAAHAAPARGVVPALGLFTGPLGGVLAAMAVLATLGRCGVGAPRLRVPSAALFLLPALVASGIAIHYAAAVEPSGDEIDYLMMTQSVWREGDLDLRDNFARGDFHEYLGGFDHMPGGTRRADGRSYPTHSPGLPFLVAPVYALGGRRALPRAPRTRSRGARPRHPRARAARGSRRGRGARGVGGGRRPARALLHGVPLHRGGRGASASRPPSGSCSRARASWPRPSPRCSSPRCRGSTCA